MTAHKDAEKETSGLTGEPDAMVGAGRLTAGLWKREKLSDGVDFDFNVFLMNRTTGEVNQRFQLRDVADLARLTQLLAAEMSTDEDLGRETCDDLACLAACLGDVLPMGFVYPGVRCREGGPAARMIGGLLRCRWDSEGRNFLMNPSFSHIYRDMVAVDAWLRGVGPSSGVDLFWIKPADIDDDEGVCPICGTNDGSYDLSDGLWFVCHDHQVRWMTKAVLCEESIRENSQDWPENDQRFRRYQEVYPMSNPDTAVKPD